MPERRVHALVPVARIRRRQGIDPVLEGFSKPRLFEKRPGLVGAHGQGALQEIAEIENLVGKRFVPGSRLVDFVLQDPVDLIADDGEPLFLPGMSVGSTR